MSQNDNSRFQTGETCQDAGWYEFDGYVDGPSDPFPNLDEIEVSLRAGDKFPRIHEPDRPCYWRMIAGFNVDNLFEAGMAIEGA